MDFVIAVDGSAASGKGTLAATLAADYALPHLDTGLLYRAVGFALLSVNEDPANAVQAELAARELRSAALENPELSSGPSGEAASKVAVHPGVRAALYDFQRRFAEQAGGAVLDGRDIGTVIAPEAAAKLWVDAAVETRAERRWKQTSGRGDQRTLAETIDDLRRRDARDAGRADAPMVRAADAVLLDTTEMSISAAADAARRIVEQARVRWLANKPA